MISSIIDSPVDRILGYGSLEHDQYPTQGVFFDIGWNWLRVLKRFLIPSWGGPNGCPTFICHKFDCRCGLCPSDPGMAERISIAVGTGIESFYEGLKYAVFYLVPDSEECECGKNHT